MTTELRTKTTIMTKVTKNLGWMLFLVLAVYFPTAVTSHEYAPCLYTQNECFRYKVIEDHWTFQLREYGTGTVATHVDTSDDFLIHLKALNNYLGGANSEGIVIPMKTPIYTRTTNGTHPTIYRMSVWLPGGPHPNANDPKILVTRTPPARFFVRRIHERTDDPSKYFKELTMALSNRKYVRDDFFMSNYDQQRWEIGLHTC